MPYLQFVKFLIMELNFIHCTNDELFCLQQNCDNLQGTIFEESVTEDLLHQSKQT